MGSDMEEFYSNANVLITGATGLFGKILVQKLLRAFDNIGCLYLIIRNKKGKSVQERLEELFSDVVFDKMKQAVPNYLEKIFVIEGDTAKTDLGLTQSDRDLIKEQVNIVFHCAASMNMNAKLKIAVDTNVRGVHELINLCQEINKLKSFLFVSTAYSNSIHHVIEEKFYDTPIPATTLMKLTEDVSEKILENIKPGLIGDWPNAYCFTKAVAEDLFYKKGKNLPIGLFRPSIVMPIYEDPCPGWTSNIYGPVGVMMATGLGVLRVFQCDKNLKSDMVPADYCINALICVAYDVHKKSVESNNHLECSKPVYNYSTGTNKRVTWNEHLQYSQQYKYPLKDALWATVIFQVSNEFVYNLLWFFLHTIPGYIIDLFSVMTGKEPNMIKNYEKIRNFSKVLTYFSTNEWIILNRNVNHLWSKLNDNEKRLFPFDIDVVDHKRLVLDTCTGIKIFIMKEGLDNIERDTKRYQRLLMLHKVLKLTTIIGVLIALLCLFLYIFMRN